MPKKRSIAGAFIAIVLAVIASVTGISGAAFAGQPGGGGNQVTDVTWQLPAGQAPAAACQTGNWMSSGNCLGASGYPQKLVTGTAPCGVWLQTDEYPKSAVAGLEADGQLTYGEDSRVVQKWKFTYTGACAPPKPTVLTPGTPTVTELCTSPGVANDAVTEPQETAQIGYHTTGTAGPGNTVTSTPYLKDTSGKYVLSSTATWSYTFKTLEALNCATPPPATIETYYVSVDQQQECVNGSLTDAVVEITEDADVQAYALKQDGTKVPFTAGTHSGAELNGVTGFEFKVTKANVTFPSGQTDESVPVVLTGPTAANCNQPPSTTRTVPKSEESCTLNNVGGTNNWTIVYTTTYSWSSEQQKFVGTEDQGVPTAKVFTPYTDADYFTKCAPVQPQPTTRTVPHTEQSCSIGGVNTWDTAYTTTYKWDNASRKWVGTESAGVDSDKVFTAYTPQQQVKEGCAVIPNPPTETCGKVTVPTDTDSVVYSETHNSAGDTVVTATAVGGIKLQTGDLKLVDSISWTEPKGGGYCPPSTPPTTPPATTVTTQQQPPAAAAAVTTLATTGTSISFGVIWGAVGLIGLGAVLGIAGALRRRKMAQEQ